METLTMNPIAAEVKLLEPASTAPKRDEAKPKKRSSVRPRAIQRDRTQRPLGAPLDEAVVERLTEIVHSATLAQVGYFHRLGLRARLLTLPVMVALVLSWVWYDADPNGHDTRFWDRLLSVIPTGALVIVDLGFNDFARWATLTARGELQALLRRVEHLLEVERMEQNRLDTAHPTVADSIRAVLATLEQEIKETRDHIRRHVGGHPSLKHRRDLLESIPGVGAATAAWLLAVLSEHDGFTNAKQAVAQVGLAPVIRQSGQWAGKTRISKTGDPRVRKVL